MFTETASGEIFRCEVRDVTSRQSHDHLRRGEFYKGEESGRVDPLGLRKEKEVAVHSFLDDFGWRGDQEVRPTQPQLAII